ncbi:lysoplasmalogenase [Chloroflexota bacterium]
MLTAILTLLAILSAFLYIRAEYYGPQYHIYLFKPLAMIFILLIAIQGSAATPFYKFAIIAGLICSIVGDTLLMPTIDRFIPGLIAFLIAHLFYITAFASGISFGLSWSLVPLAIYGIAIYAILSPSLGQLKLPVATYIVVILVMGWLAWERWSQTGQNDALLALLGAILFVISDSILAIHRFRGPYKLGRALNLSTYFAAQCLIAGSVGALVL